MKKTNPDHALSVIKAGISLVPIVGGAISSLIGDYVPAATQRSIEKSLEILSESLKELDDRIDVENVDKDEFSELFKASYLTIVRTHKEEKLSAATSLVVNILLKEGDPDKLSYRELDHYARCIDNLSIGAIEVLCKIYDMSGRPDFKGRGSTQYRFDINKLCKETSLSPELTMGLLGELNSLHLVHLPGSPGVRTPDYGNYPVEFTELGARFIVHILHLARA
jgi:hypothetical protein